MTREERLKFCSICKHQHMDMKKGIVCSLTNEYADFEENCEKYEPSDEFLKQQRAKTIASRLKGKYTENSSIIITAIVLTIYLLPIIFEVCKNHPADATFSFISLCFLIIIIAGIYYYFFQYKKQGKGAGLITTKDIENVIKIEGFYPQKQDGGWITFKDSGNLFAIDYDAPHFRLCHSIGGVSGDYNIATSAARITMENLPMVKVLIEQDEHEQKPSSTIDINFIVHTWILHTNELSAHFPHFYRLLHIAEDTFREQYQKLKEELEAKYSSNSRIIN